MTHIHEIELSPSARQAFPGVTVLATRLALPNWQQAAQPDWAALRVPWLGMGKAELLSHPDIEPFCALQRRMGINTSKQPPSFANFILRGLTKVDARVPTVNAVVDWVNHAAVSTRTSLGVFDAAAVQGRLQLDLSRVASPSNRWVLTANKRSKKASSCCVTMSRCCRFTACATACIRPLARTRGR